MSSLQELGHGPRKHIFYVLVEQGAGEDRVMTGIKPVMRFKTDRLSDRKDHHLFFFLSVFTPMWL